MQCKIVKRLTEESASTKELLEEGFSLKVIDGLYKMGAIYFDAIPHEAPINFKLKVKD